MEEYQRAFDQLKEYLSHPPLLVSYVDGERIFMYLVVTESVVNSVICAMCNENMMPIYYVSHA